MDRKDWPTAVYRDFDTPDRDDRAYYAGLTPAERIAIMIALLPQSTARPQWIVRLGSLVTRRLRRPQKRPALG